MIINEQQLINLINETTELQIKKMMENIKFDKTQLAEVVDVNAGNVDIKFIGSLTTLTNIPNYTGQTLVVSDKVWCTALNGDLSKIIATYKV